MSRNLFFNISIKYRLLLYFLFLGFIPILIIMVTIYNRSTNIITHKINSAIERNLDMIQDSTLKKFEAAHDFSLSVYFNPELVQILSSERPVDEIGIYNEIISINNIIEYYYQPNPEKTVFIPKIYMLNRPEYQHYNFSDKVFDISLIEKEEWYLKLPPEARYTIVGPNKVRLSSTTLNTVRIAKRLFGLRNYYVPYTALLTVDINLDEFTNILDYYKPSINSSVLVIDSTADVITSSHAALKGKNPDLRPFFREKIITQKRSQGFFIYRTDNSEILVSYKKMAPPGWTIIALSPMSEIHRELISLRRLIYLVLIVCIVFAFIMALLLSENVSYPIRKLVKSMHTVQDGNFEITLEYKRNDEFSYLINTYKKMVQQLKALINKLYITEIREKEAELKALQAQINPHFLYNTLDSINWLAIKHNIPDISIMVTSLSDFYRYSLSKGKTIIPFEDEKKQIESYLAIQNVRFQGKLKYTINFAPEVLGYLTVKLILQPIVENSIIHGIEKTRAIGEITITAEKVDEVIMVKITDNGVGANIDELNAILEDSTTVKSFAIKNVNERIKEYFGATYGIRFHQNEGSGVTVVIRIPAVKTMEGL